MTNVCYNNCCKLQEISSEINKGQGNPGHVECYNRKKPWYDYYTEIMLDPSKQKAVTPKVKDLPNHPANPNHPDHGLREYW